MRRLFIVYPLMFLVLFASVGCAATQDKAVSEVRNPQWAKAVEAKGLKNLFQVSPDVYRSAQPEAEGMLSAEKLGIRTVLSLRTSDKDQKIVEGRDLRLEKVAMRAGSISEAEIIAALRVLRTAPKPVLVHCYHGADRTGLTVAMYRIIFQNWSKEEAKAELLNGGFGFHSIWTNIPKFIDNVDVEEMRREVMRGA